MEPRWTIVIGRSKIIIRLAYTIYVPTVVRRRFLPSTTVACAIICTSAVSSLQSTCVLLPRYAPWRIPRRLQRAESARLVQPALRWALLGIQTHTTFNTVVPSPHIYCGINTKVLWGICTASSSWISPDIAAWSRRTPLLPLLVACLVRRASLC